MTLDLTSTITGKEVDGWWIFTDIMAERVSKVTGLKLATTFGGRVTTGFPAKQDYIYTPKIVKNGFKLCITK